MDCWHCGHDLTWGGDHDIDKDQTSLFGEYSMVTNLTCPIGVVSDWTHMLLSDMAGRAP